MSQPRSDLHINLPALRTLDTMLLVMSQLNSTTFAALLEMEGVANLIFSGGRVSNIPAGTGTYWILDLVSGSKADFWLV